MSMSSTTTEMIKYKLYLHTTAHSKVSQLRAKVFIPIIKIFQAIHFQLTDQIEQQKAEF
jgi:hypothetical protein